MGRRGTGRGWLSTLRKGIGFLYFLFLGLTLTPLGAGAVPPPPGDANADGSVNQTDIPFIVNTILQTAVAPGNPNCNSDAAVNVLDVICVNNLENNLGPVITGISPPNASVGDLVTITGNHFPPGSLPKVTMPKLGGGTIDVPVVQVTSTSIVVVIPNGAGSGPFTVTFPGQPDMNTGGSLSILPSSDFNLLGEPAAAKVVQGYTASYAIKLQSANGFNQLASLSASGLPAGVTAVFSPPQIGVGQTALLTLTAATDQPPILTSFSVQAQASIDGLPVTDTLVLGLEVKPVSTSFVGRTVIDDPLRTPLAGVTITWLGRDGQGNSTGCSGTTISDAAGNFAFFDLPAACTGGQLLRYDGSTATNPPGIYAGVDLWYDILPGQVNTSPVLIHLPEMGEGETVLVVQNAAYDQTFRFRTIPNLEVTVYAGTIFTLVDGSVPNPFPLIAINIPVDRLPDTMPPMPNELIAFIVAFQPANATASQPVAVTFPNPLRTAPGSVMPLTTLDPTKGVMVEYGTGTVSLDSLSIIPDLDPAHPGHRYGLVHFDWHGPVLPPPPPPPPAPPCQGDDGGGRKPPKVPPCQGDGASPRTNNPIDIATGIEVVTHTDMLLRSSIGNIAITRVYRSLSTIPGPFGIGTSHNYGFQLDSWVTAGTLVVNLILPEGNRFPFVKDVDGLYRNTTSPAFRGATLEAIPGANQAELRWGDGTLFHFSPAFVNGFPWSVLTSSTDTNGNRTDFVYTGNLMTEVVAPDGRALSLQYDGQNRITSLSDPLGRTVSYTYNAQGTLATQTDPAGGVTTYDYDPGNRLTRITDSRGIVVVRNEYDANGRVIRQTHADGGVETFAYTLMNPVAPTSPVLETLHTDALGNATRYRYDALGYFTDATDPLGRATLFDRDPATHQLVAIRGTAACPTCGNAGLGDKFFAYDDAGDQIERTDALDNSYRFTYEPVFGKVTVLEDPLGNLVTSTYDAKGNLLAVTDSLGHSTHLAYDSLGLLTTATDALGGVTSIARDSNNFPAEITDALGASTASEFDILGRAVVVTDKRGRTTSLMYDALDRITQITDAAGQVTSFAYDAISNLLSVTDARGNTTTFEYDSMNRRIKKTDSLGRFETWAYDLNGRMIGHTDRRGETRVYSYDAVGRRLQAAYSDGNVVNYFYDQRDRVIRVEDSAGGVFSLEWDAVGNLLSESGPLGTINYQYDALKRLIRRQVVGQDPVTYNYDAAGRVIGVDSPQAAVDLSYDDLDRVLTLARSNGVTTSYDYDALGRVLNIAHAKGPTLLHQETYSYDPAGNRLGYTTPIPQPIPPTLTNTIDTNSNRLLQRDAVQYSYDDNGNRLSETAPGGGLIQYTWDARNRLVAIDQPSGLSTQYQYDYTGNLIERLNQSPSGSFATWYLNDLASNVVYQADDSGDQRSILTGLGIDSHLAAIPATGSPVFGLMDSINSTLATTDNTGALSSQHAYAPYGGGTPPGSGFPFGFTGRVPVEAGLYYYRARFYDPAAGRFVSEDPIGLRGGMNTYLYAAGAPINFVDPLGLDNNSLLDHAAMIVHSLSFAAAWGLGQTESSYYYGDGSMESTWVKNSSIGNLVREAYVLSGCANQQRQYSNLSGFDYFQYLFSSGITFQIGNFSWSAVNINNGLAKFKINNTAGTNSFFAHIPPNIPSGYPMGLVNQQFEWVERINCPCR